MTALLDLIGSRRSVGGVSIQPVARGDVELVLRAGLAAPNHNTTRPWRFIVLAGPARGELSHRLERAPVVIACVVCGSDGGPVQAREDRDAVAAAIQNMLLAAHALGLASIWRTGEIVDDPMVASSLGLAEDDRIVGFVYLGHPLGPASPRIITGDDLSEAVEWRWPTNP